ncbi:FtsB family cell division protein [Anaerobranca gottschalkii]|uniref:Septum formation initiator n=1 Tax=Anaerobranca gottschalkii DSM 13577 TaxID=1120990 RepID=A0A1I0CX13_9FIRM|nr:septum formation initiator family protein [Anaerobranca gottschalkii]SET24305.1 Septum formation initiator [Anaerobranca gottschalkii DSM 13577]
MAKGTVKVFFTYGSRTRRIVLYIAIIYTLITLVKQQITLSKIQHEIENYNIKIQNLEEENHEYRRAIERLHDLEYIEYLARKELGLVRKGERVYIFSKQ